MPTGFLQTDGSPGGASGPAAAAVAGRWAVCGCELQSAANLLHPADAPPSSRRWWHTHCQVSRAELKTHLIELFHSRFVSEDLEQCFFCFRSEMEVEGVVVSLVHCFQTSTVALQLEDGQIRKLLWGQLPIFLFCCWILCFAKLCFARKCIKSRSIIWLFKSHCTAWRLLLSASQIEVILPADLALSTIIMCCLVESGSIRGSATVLK